MEKKNNEEEINKLQEMWEDPKGKATLKLIGWLVFIVIVVIYARVINSKNNKSVDTTKKDTVVDTSASNNTFSKLSDNNYQYNIRIDIVKDNVTTGYIYTGKIKDTTQIITKDYNNTQITYKKDKDLYYQYIDNKYQLVTEDIIYDYVKPSYISMDNIITYINKGTKDYETKYANGNVLTSYKVLLKDILLDDSNENFITIDVLKEKDTYKFTIDYTSLFKLTDATISSYKVTSLIDSIGDITDNDISE